MQGTFFLHRPSEANTHCLLIISTSCTSNSSNNRTISFNTREQIISSSRAGHLVSTSHSRVFLLIKIACIALNVSFPRETWSTCLSNEAAQKGMQSVSRKHQTGKQGVLWKNKMANRTFRWQLR